MLFMKYFVVFSKRLSKALVSNGFEIKKIEKNKKNPKYNVFLFEETLELKNNISKILKNPPN